MPLANKEVVHLKTGWEKIQVRVLLFTTLFLYRVRSFVCLSLSSFFFLLCVCVFTKKMQQQQQQNEIGNGDLSSLGTDFEMCLTRLLTSLSLSLSLSTTDRHPKAEKLVRQPFLEEQREQRREQRECG